MSNTAIVVALLVGVAVWFAVASRLTAKPWDNREQAGDVGAINFAPARIGLWLFMAVVTSLFSLFLDRVLDAHARRGRLVPPDDAAHRLAEHAGAGRGEHRDAARLDRRRPRQPPVRAGVRSPSPARSRSPSSPGR